jgi:hypothetical protein
MIKKRTADAGAPATRRTPDAVNNTREITTSFCRDAVINVDNDGVGKSAESADADADADADDVASTQTSPLRTRKDDTLCLPVLTDMRDALAVLSARGMERFKAAGHRLQWRW